MDVGILWSESEGLLDALPRQKGSSFFLDTNHLLPQTVPIYHGLVILLGENIFNHNLL